MTCMCNAPIAVGGRHVYAMPRCRAGRPPACKALAGSHDDRPVGRRRTAATVYQALQDTSWRLERTVHSRFQGTPSGLMTGTASWMQTAKPNELRYHEDGHFTTQGSSRQLHMKQEYFWQYTDSNDRIDVYFSRAGSVSGYLFHPIHFLSDTEGCPVSRAHDVSCASRSSMAADVRVKRRLYAVGERHLCRQDVHDTKYMFQFGGSDRNLTMMEIVYEVKGPHTGYTSKALYLPL